MAFEYLAFAKEWAPVLAKGVARLWKHNQAQATAQSRAFSLINDTFGDPLALAQSYIEPDLQNFSPADDPEDVTGSELRFPAFHHLDRWLAGTRENNRRLLVLADAGMGKTSLLVMLKVAHLLGNWPDGIDVRLLKLGPTTLDDIKAIEAKNNTVLLLDSLDEDATVRDRVEARLTELLDATLHFRRVVLTCRTQFFSGGYDPFDKRGRVAVGGHLVEVLYLSLFSDPQVEAFLKKRYPRRWRDWFARRPHPNVDKVRPRLEQMKELRFRPMLLRHVDDVLERQAAWTTYEVLEAMVEAWLNREQLKSRLRGREVPWQKLLHGCIAVARALHDRGLRMLPEQELAQVVEDAEAATGLSTMDIGGRALLNRTSAGDFRFAHRLVEEYLLVRWASGLPKDSRVTLSLSEAMWNMALQAGARGQPLPIAMLMASAKPGTPLVSTSPFRPAMHFIPAGTFTMGSPEDEAGRDQQEVRHQVTLTRPFLMMATPVTRGQWRALMGTTPSYFTRDENLPVESVNWFEAVALANALSEKKVSSPAYLVEGREGTLGGGLKRGEDQGQGDFKYASVTLELDANGYHLPTEAEWEYACRAGTADTIYGGNWALLGENNAPALDPIAWYGGNSGVKHTEGVESKWPEMQKPAVRSATHPVGLKQANPWGLYDMLGNVWEWCGDWYGNYDAKKSADPSGPAEGRNRVFRGGSWFSNARWVRSANRNRRHPDVRGHYQGFRLVRHP